MDCHKDEHNGQFAASPWLNKCEQCHTGATWKTSNYTLAKHQKSTFRNFGVVQPGVLYRSAQLSKAGMTRAMYDYGIKTVISLREVKLPAA